MTDWPRFTFQEPDIVSVYRDATDHGLFWNDRSGTVGRGMFRFEHRPEQEKPITHEEAVSRQPKVAQMFPMLTANEGDLPSGPGISKL